MAYRSQFPPVFNDTYVKATSYIDASGHAFLSCDPSKSLTGGQYPNVQWLSENTKVTNQRFHIDLGTAVTITRIYYENSHDSGVSTGYGVKNFTLWGSNTAAAFAELTYGTDTNWTQLTTSQSTFDQHTGSDVADPKYITVTNTTAYRYYAIKCADAWSSTAYMGLRRIELQATADTKRLSQTSLINDANLVSYWPLNGDFEDKKSGYNLTAVDTPTQRTDAFGVSNGAYAFNGSSQYAYVAHASCPNLDIDDNSFTWMAWVYLDTIGEYRGLIGKDTGDGGRNHLMTTGSNTTTFATNGVTETYADPYITGVWIFTSVIYDKTNAKKKIWMDRKKYETDVSGTLAMADADFCIAALRYPTSPNYFHDGAMCEVAVFNRALTDTEINNYYDGLLPGLGGPKFINFI